MTDLTARLRTALRTAMLDKDRDAVAALRSALAAIENAAAVDTTGPGLAIEEAPVGVGVNDVARQVLAPADLVAIVNAEIHEHETGAAQYDDLGRTDEAASLTLPMYHTVSTGRNNCGTAVGANVGRSA